MVLSLPLTLILELLFVCIGGVKENASDSLNDRFSTDDFPTSETLFLINDTLNGKDDITATTVGLIEASESDQVEDNVFKIGNIEESEELNACGRPPTIERTRITGQNSPPYTIGTSLSYSCEFGYSADRATHVSVCSQSSANSKPSWTDPQIRCNPRACGDPGFVANAERIGSQFTFPNSVSFECDDGYKISGPNIRYCQVNGRWSGILPTCEKIVCETPEKPENGLVFFSSLDYGSTLSYTCNKGFILKNDHSRICSENGTWSGIEPLCVEAKCKFPVAPEHGSVEMVGGIPRIDSIAVYSCEGSRRLVGSPISKCLDIGEWTFQTPKCLEPCFVPNVPQGTIGRYEKKRWKYDKQFITLTPGDRIQDGEELILRCNEKFWPLGKNKAEVKVFCDKTEWKENPVCKPAKCETDPPETNNAKIARAGKEHGGTVVYRCYPTFEKVKYGNVTCHFGTWIGYTPICADSKCYADKMDFPGVQKDIKNVYINKEQFTPSCTKGYEVSAPDNVFICKDGNWKGNFPPCKVASCSRSPPSIEHGYIKSFKKLHSSFVEYECEDSYELTSSNKVQCSFGEWKGTPPVCEDLRCYFQDLKSKEGILIPAKDPTESGRSLEVQCATGYHELFIEPFCTKGEWVEAQISPCKENSCLVHEIQNGAITDRTYTKRFTWKGRVEEYKYEMVRIGHKVDAGKFLYATCLQGFSFQGTNLNDVKTKCTRGKWKPTPICLIPGTNYEEEPEDESEAPRNTQATKAKDIISYISSTPLTTASDILKTTVPVSEHSVLVLESAEDCFCLYAGSEDLVAYADNQLLKAGSNVKKNSIVKFHCENFGYNRLIGNKELVCKNCRPWNSAEYPRCDPPSFGDATFRWSEDFRILPGGVLTVNQGLDVLLACFGEQREAYPIWTYHFDESITSSGKYDERFENPFYALLEIRNTSPKHNGQYNCHLDGYRKNSVQLQVKAQCRIFEESDDLTVHYDDGQNINSSALFNCNDRKKMIEGSRILTCLENGQWSGQPPICTSLCPDLEETENMEIIFSEGLRAGSMATFHCHVPYERNGVAALQCLSNGKWSGKAPTCISPLCSLEDLYNQLPQTVTANLKEETDNYLPLGFEINLICEGNMMLSTPASAKCGINKEWEIPATNCISGCAPIHILPESQMIIEPVQDFYRFGEYVELSCMPGQVLSTEVEVLMCLSTGWSENEIPSCKDEDSEDA